jgi:hypothetical protein
MTYQRPEVAALGNAASLIQGFKNQQPLEQGSTTKHVIPDCELDN